MAHFYQENPEGQVQYKAACRLFQQMSSTSPRRVKPSTSKNSGNNHNATQYLLEACQLESSTARHINTSQLVRKLYDEFGYAPNDQQLARILELAGIDIGSGPSRFGAVRSDDKEKGYIFIRSEDTRTWTRLPDPEYKVKQEQKEKARHVLRDVRQAMKAEESEQETRAGNFAAECAASEKRVRELQQIAQDLIRCLADRE